LTACGDYHPTSLLLARDFLKEDPRVPKRLIKSRKYLKYHSPFKVFRPDFGTRRDSNPVSCHTEESGLYALEQKSNGSLGR
jgi:hypothetical protein